MVVNLYEQQIREISTDDLKDRMNRKDRGLMIVDARELTEYYKGHIPGACSIFDGEIMSIAKDLDKNMDIVVYGPGKTEGPDKPETRLSGDAALKLKDMGFKNVMEYRGGLQEWANNGNQVDRTEPESVKPAAFRSQSANTGPP